MRTPIGEVENSSQLAVNSSQLEVNCQPLTANPPAPNTFGTVGLRRSSLNSHLSYLLIVFLLLITNMGWGQTTIAGWDFNGLSGGTNNFGSSPLTASTTASNITAGGLTRASGFGTTGTGATNAWGGTGNGTATFTSVKWGTAGAPTITAAAGKMDILSFVSDGTNWYGSIAQGYTP